MRRRLDILVVLVALLLAAQPLLHNHRFAGDSDGSTTTAPSACAVCATGVGRLPTTAPALAAPLSVLYTLVSEPVPMVAAITRLTRDSRGPPAA